MSYQLVSPAAVAAMVLSLAAVSRAEESESLESLPAAARKTAEAIVKQNKVTEVEPAFEDGQKAYEVEYEKDHVEMAIVLNAEGKLLRSEQRLSPDQAPEVIKKASEAAFPGSTITSIKKVEKGTAKAFYEVALRSADKKTENLKFDLEGKKLK